MFCKCFTVVTCKIKRENIFANVLQMSYVHVTTVLAKQNRIRINLRL